MKEQFQVQTIRLLDLEARNAAPLSGLIGRPMLHGAWLDHSRVPHRFDRRSTGICLRRWRSVRHNHPCTFGNTARLRGGTLADNHQIAQGEIKGRAQHDEDSTSSDCTAIVKMRSR